MLLIMINIASWTFRHDDDLYVICALLVLLHPQSILTHSKCVLAD